MVQYVQSEHEWHEKWFRVAVFVLKLNKIRDLLWTLNMFMPTGQTNQALFKLNNNKNTGEDRHVLNLSQAYILKPWSITFTSKFEQVLVSLLAYSLFVYYSYWIHFSLLDTLLRPYFCLPCGRLSVNINKTQGRKISIIGESKS